MRSFPASALVLSSDCCCESLLPITDPSPMALLTTRTTEIEEKSFRSFTAPHYIILPKPVAVSVRGGGGGMLSNRAPEPHHQEDRCGVSIGREPSGAARRQVAGGELRISRQK